MTGLFSGDSLLENSDPYGSHCIWVISYMYHYSVYPKFFFNIKLTWIVKGDGCISCVLFKISWHFQTQIAKYRILSDSLLGTKLYSKTCVKRPLKNR